MKGLCSYCSRYFFCSKRPKQNEEDVILCSRFTQNNDNEETIDEAPMAYKPTEEIVELIKPTVDVIDVIKPIYNFKAKL